MSDATKTPGVVSRTFLFKPNLKGTPDRLKGWEVKFQNVDHTASLEDATAFLLERSGGSEETAVAFLSEAIATAQDKDLDSFVDTKHREEGKTYTREEIKKLPQTSAVISKEDLQAWANGWEIDPPKIKPESKVAAAEAARRRAEEEKEAAAQELLALLAETPKAKRQEKLDRWIAAGIVPEGTELPA